MYLYYWPFSEEDTSLGTVALIEAGSSVFTYFTSTLCDMNTLFTLVIFSVIIVKTQSLH